MVDPDDAFAHLFHAYGPATDTPAHLRALRGADGQAHAEAVAHLWSAVLHQGTPGTVTPVVVLELVELLRTKGSSVVELRCELLAFLTEVATEGTSPTTGRPELEAMRAAHPDVGERLVELYAEGREEEFYDDPDLTGAALAEAVLGCRDVQRFALPTFVALGLEAGSPAERAAASRAACAAYEVLLRDDAPTQDHAVAALHPLLVDPPGDDEVLFSV